MKCEQFVSQLSFIYDSTYSLAREWQRFGQIAVISS